MGLNDKLKLAATSDVVENLLQEGIGFKEASPKTKRRWKLVAVRRLKEIQASKETKAVSEKKAEKIPRSKKLTA